MENQTYDFFYKLCGFIRSIKKLSCLILSACIGFSMLWLSLNWPGNGSNHLYVYYISTQFFLQVHWQRSQNIKWNWKLQPRELLKENCSWLKPPTINFHGTQCRLQQRTCITMRGGLRSKRKVYIWNTSITTPKCLHSIPQTSCKSKPFNVIPRCYT